jgi:monovalent cation/hydrogen antiporter
VAIGLVLGVAVHALRTRLQDPVVESVLGLTVPFAAYLLAEELHGSGVLAVVAAGLYLGYRGPEAGYATRLQERPLWSSLDLLLEAVVFALIGLQLRYVLGEVQASDRSNASLLVAAVVVLVVVVVVRFAFVFGLELARRSPRPSRSGLTRPERPPWSYQVVISWTGMRGVVTLAAAAALPTEVQGEPFTERGAVQFLAFAVTIGTLLVQGLTLPGLINRLGVQDSDQPRRDAEEELLLQERSTEVALARLDDVIAGLVPRIGEEKAKQWDQRIREPLLARTATMHQAIRGEEEDEVERGRRRAQTFRRVRQEVIEVQRQVLMEERDKGTVDEEVVRAVLQELDHEEAAGASSWVSRF